ncbi:hypothetical protein [Adhaeribacter pallidiroseus]|uniref:Uncharacterized protein n=1 Tax=Adhaeribacter pallidiroseus TaxID=2072847 RepID=A0A369QB72_9BACT|nr:hypothetical protein [Adhaeribacter pallidiroseus]RDC61570.1 hypothetical protein AHMF7616_00149 [Adhaeribacter pallidiroseus]
MNKWWLMGILWGLISWSAQAQYSNQRCKWVMLADAPIQLDSLTILPGSIVLRGAAADTLKFIYNPSLNQFQLLRAPVPAILLDSLKNVKTTSNLPRDSVLVCYRVLPFNLSMARYRRKITANDSVYLPGTKLYTEEIGVKKEELFRTPGLNKSGTITRGISFGNTQNVFVNSALNLQLEGKLSEDIGITASISDQNVPFQPQGNTQQLQEFDRIFITLQHKLWNVTAGDIVLRNKPDYFLRYYKNVQGAAFEVNYTPKPNQKASTSAVASVAKGKFSSIQVKPIENVQGPYRLTGPASEKYVIVLANSEKVYLDGKLLTRGFDYDYVIDYNQAEITFTTRNVIIQSSRIRIDFEYSDRNYNRTIYQASHYQQINKLNIHANLYNESDNPNNLLNLDLRPSDKQLLSEIGDSLQQAFTPGVETVPYDPQQVLYKDSTVMINNNTQPIYVYTEDSTLAAYYSLRFTDVGSGKGDYVPVTTTVNGRSFKWVAPIDGRPQGRYMPVRILPTPIQKQMATIGANYQVNKETSVYLEAAGSKYDINRFSSKDSDNDHGKAIKVGYTVREKALPILGKYKLQSSFNYEFTDRNFVPIDRYRDVEFDRDWSNGVTANTQQSDNIVNFSVGLMKDNTHALNYRISRRYRSQEVDGVQHYLDVAQTFKGFSLKGNFFTLYSTRLNQVKSAWVRGLAEISYPTKNLVPGYTYRFDKNREDSVVNPDSLTNSAIYFDEHLFFVRSKDSAATRYGLSYGYRADRRPRSGELSQPENAQTYNGYLQTKVGGTQDIQAQLTYRQVSSVDSLNKATVLSTINWNGDLLQRHLRSELSYTVATGREVKREYEFIQTVPGQGTHYLMPGGNPRDLNDYYEAQTPDAQYRTHIKVFLPTDQYIIAYTNRLSYRLNSSLPRNWQQAASNFKKMASRLTAITSITIDKKTTDSDLTNRFNPFSQNIEDSLLLSMINSFRNTLYYNRSNPKFGLEFTIQQNQQKVLLTNGTEARNLLVRSLGGRYNLNEYFTSKLQLNRTIRSNTSNYLSTRNYRIRAYEALPELAFQPNNKLRFTSTYQYAIKKNIYNSDNPEGAVFNDLGLESRLSQVNKRTFSGQLHYTHVFFRGNVNTPIGYEMLNALRPGNNFTWNLNLQQRLSNGLNLSFNYDGRKPNNLRTFHSGRMQVSVLF